MVEELHLIFLNNTIQPIYTTMYYVLSTMYYGLSIRYYKDQAQLVGLFFKKGVLEFLVYRCTLRSETIFDN